MNDKETAHYQSRLTSLVAKGVELSWEMNGGDDGIRALIDGSIIGLGFGLGGLFGGVVTVAVVGVAELSRTVKNAVKMGSVNRERTRLGHILYPNL